MGKSFGIIKIKQEKKKENKIDDELAGFIA